MARLVVDPVTRIEGHLRIEAQMDGGKIADAWSSGTMFRGIELILKDRDPREAWIWAQRICGVCTMVHALASVRAVEDALQIEVPDNARIVRNLIAGSQMVQDHVVHFYHLHALDWVDVASALKADPAKTSSIAQSISDYEKSSTTYFRGIQQRVKAVVDSGQLSLFASGYWGHPAYQLPPEVNLLAVAHYLEALSWQKDFIRIHAALGGKNPHPQTFLVGGMSTAMDPNEPFAVINPEQITFLRQLVKGALKFVEQVYIPDVLAIAPLYKDWFSRGEGLGNFLSYGDYSAGNEQGPSSFLFPRGAIFNHDLTQGAPGGCGQDHRVRQPFLVRLFGRRRQRPASIPGRNQSQVLGSQTALRATRRGQEVLLAQVAALRREAHGSGSAGAHGGRLCVGQPGDPRVGGRHFEETQCPARRAVFDAGPHRGAGPRVAVDGSPVGTLGRSAVFESGARKSRHLQSGSLGSGQLAGLRFRLRLA